MFNGTVELLPAMDVVPLSHAIGATECFGVEVNDTLVGQPLVDGNPLPICTSVGFSVRRVATDDQLLLVDSNQGDCEIGDGALSTFVDEAEPFFLVGGSRFGPDDYTEISFRRGAASVGFTLRLFGDAEWCNETAIRTECAAPCTPVSSIPLPTVQVTAHDSEGVEIGRVVDGVAEGSNYVALSTDCDDEQIHSVRLWHRGDPLSQGWLGAVSEITLNHRLPSLHSNIDSVLDPVSIGTDELVAWVIRVFNGGEGDAYNVTVPITIDWPFNAVPADQVALEPADASVTQVSQTEYLWFIPYLAENDDAAVMLGLPTTLVCTLNDTAVYAESGVPSFVNEFDGTDYPFPPVDGGAAYDNGLAQLAGCADANVTCSTDDGETLLAETRYELNLTQTVTPMAVVAGEPSLIHGNLNVSVTLANAGPSCYVPTTPLLLEFFLDGVAWEDLNLEEFDRRIQFAWRGQSFPYIASLFDRDYESVDESNVELIIDPVHGVDWIAINGATFCSDSSSQEGLGTSDDSSSTSQSSNTEDTFNEVGYILGTAPAGTTCDVRFDVEYTASGNMAGPDDAVTVVSDCTDPTNFTTCSFVDVNTNADSTVKVVSYSLTSTEGSSIAVYVSSDCDDSAIQVNVTNIEFVCSLPIITLPDGTMEPTVLPVPLPSIPAGGQVTVDAYIAVGPAAPDNSVFVSNASHYVEEYGEVLSASDSVRITREVDVSLAKSVYWPKHGAPVVPGSTFLCPLPGDELDDYSYTSETGLSPDDDDLDGTVTTTPSSISSSMSDRSSGFETSSSSSSSVSLTSDYSETRTNTIPSDVRELGGHIIFELVVNNTGPSDATNLVIDLTPDVLEHVDFIGANWPSDTSFDREAGQWTIPELRPWESRTIYTAFYVGACAVSGNFSCAADLTSVSEANVSNETSVSATAVLTRVTNPTITIVDSLDPVGAGCTDPAFEYHLVLLNEGPSCLSGDGLSVNVTLQVPEFGVALSTVESVFVELGTISSFTVDPTDDSLFHAVWTFDSSLDLLPGDSLSLTVPMAVGANAIGGTDAVVLSGVVFADMTDSDDTDNSASEGTTVLALPNLHVAKVDTVDPVVAGAPLSALAGDGKLSNVAHIVTLTHLAPVGGLAMTARDVVVEDQYALAPGIVLNGVSTSVGSATIDEDESTVSWTVGDFAAGDEATMYLHYEVSSGAAVGTDCILDEARVRASVPDYCNAVDESGLALPPLAIPYDDKASETTSVIRQVELLFEPEVAVRTVEEVRHGVAKKVSELAVFAELTNVGPSDAADLAIRVDIDLPPNAVVQELEVSSGILTSKHPTASGFSMWVLPLNHEETAKIRLTVRAYEGGEVTAVFIVDEELSEEEIINKPEGKNVVGFTVRRKLER
jgi:hypothetical protein